jgi:hypothetical protein
MIRRAEASSAFGRPLTHRLDEWRNGESTSSRGIEEHFFRIGAKIKSQVVELLAGERGDFRRRFAVGRAGWKPPRNPDDWMINEPRTP